MISGFLLCCRRFFFSVAVFRFLLREILVSKGIFKRGFFEYRGRAEKSLFYMKISTPPPPDCWELLQGLEGLLDSISVPGTAGIFSRSGERSLSLTSRAGILGDI